ncbi:2-keto-4-pentenoate hydratase/2-oxohepta-3-ene-1,7-dioic acid hydratase in catechol pathway [Kushneria sinocarnis]|uniref:2-keto-4-pentenoate hydratase/2-oxohepta-3-ene-1,7-dioic acid hydratase in catechol pathway n=1 Tax=Kushneria sinocarnis TaxID=595502 RepID=A0A420WSG9_9GAMM|nr:fumarylacetoacetate hydrolase family protein [Kushneria sinocarnis]RKQ95706.1 2-keto-4-pentenoate hydratase/2-oxohepta-3-ene-1,7-dioic acid hydratase in catechol pathway [Kushneria sinocarnis]
MAFPLRFTDGRSVGRQLGKIVCIGRNYAAHARELDNAVPETPLLFIKPATSAVALAEPIRVPSGRGAVHFETELALLIDRPLSHATPDQALAAIAGMGLALDLTLREVQAELKRQGHPWERAKGFDGACPLSDFVPVDGSEVAWQQLHFSLTIDGEPRQQGDTSLMLFDVAALLVEMSRSFTLEPGDVILTGTPEGVGELPGDAELTLELGASLAVTTRTVAGDMPGQGREAPA